MMQPALGASRRRPGEGNKIMRNHRDALLSLMFGFAATSAVLLPPVLADQAAKASRIAAHDAAIGNDGVPLGAERQARLVYLMRHADKAEFDPLGRKE
jgi:hypothetical protein